MTLKKEIIEEIQYCERMIKETEAIPFSELSQQAKTRRIRRYKIEAYHSIKKLLEDNNCKFK